MRIVFMGTPEFAVPALDVCAESHDVVAVYTRPDSASGRGATLRPSAVKQRAQTLGLAVRQPATLRDADEQRSLRELEPDVIVVSAYGLILPPAVLEVPRRGCINVHASLLPRWRGAAPVERAILAGDAEAGVSIMRMEEGLDTGPYCVQSATPIGVKTASDLTAELASLGSAALSEALRLMAQDSCVWTPQTESLVTYADKISKDETLLSPSLGVDDALRRVRASSRRAPARARLGGVSVTVVTAVASELIIAPGALSPVSEGVLLGFADGCALVKRLRPEGRSDMNASDWSRGARLRHDSTWSSV